MSQNGPFTRDAAWVRVLVVGAPVPDYGSMLRVVDVVLAGQPTRYIAVVPDAKSRLPYACNGEVGPVEDWQLTRAVRDAMRADAGQGKKCAIVAVIDVASRVYDRYKGVCGVHLVPAAAADAYAAARSAGHSVIGLIVSRTMSGAPLAHNYQTDRLLALDDADVMMHAMGKVAAAHIVLRSVANLERPAREIPPMAYDIASFASLGLLRKLLEMKSTDAPDADDADTAWTALAAVLADIITDPSRGLESRLGTLLRGASSEVRKRLREQWNAQPEGA